MDNKIVRAVLAAVATAGVFVAVNYIIDVLIQHGSFSPNWLRIGGFALLGGFLTYFGPDAAQRKQNRQDLKNKFTKKH